MIFCGCKNNLGFFDIRMWPGTITADLQQHCYIIPGEEKMEKAEINRSD